MLTSVCVYSSAVVSVVRERWRSLYQILLCRALSRGKCHIEHGGLKASVQEARAHSRVDDTSELTSSRRFVCCLLESQINPGLEQVFVGKPPPR